MTKHDENNMDDFDDDVTIAASGDGVERLREELASAGEDAGPAAGDDLPVWTGDSGARDDGAGNDGPGDPGLVDEPTVITFANEPTDDLVAKPRERRRVSKGSLIEGVAPPDAATEFFSVSDLAARQTPTSRMERRGGRYPLWMLATAVALVAVTVTVVVLLVLGTSTTTGVTP